MSSNLRPKTPHEKSNTKLTSKGGISKATTPQAKTNNARNKPRTFTFGGGGGDEKDEKNEKNENDEKQEKNDIPEKKIINFIVLKDKKSDLSKLRDLFVKFRKMLNEQEENLIQRWNNESAMMFDEDHVSKYISNIGLMKGKKFEELENEQNGAIEKLKEILQFEETSRLQREEALKLQKAVDEEINLIEKQTQTVELQLSKARPAIEEAKLAVSKIKKNHLTELRALQKPPEKIVLVMTAALELVLTNRGNDGKAVDLSKWEECRKFINADFIKSVLEFDTMKLNKIICTKIEEKYLSHKEFNYESVSQASVVAGPMVLWIKSQINYAILLNSIKPMLDEIEELKIQLNERQMEYKQYKNKEEELKIKIKACRSEMLEMVGYRKIGDLYFL